MVYAMAAANHGSDVHYPDTHKCHRIASVVFGVSRCIAAGVFDGWSKGTGGLLFGLSSLWLCALLEGAYWNAAA